MRKLNDFKLVNVRISQTLFEHIKIAVPFVEENMPNPFGGGMPSLLKGSVLVAMKHNIESLYKIMKERYDSTSSPAMEKTSYSLLLEISELYSVMRKDDYQFAYIMVDVENPVYKTPFERMGISA